MLYLYRFFFIFKINLQYLFKLILVKKNFPIKKSIKHKNFDVIFNTSYHWTFSWFEYAFMRKLSKNNRVLAIVCDGLDYCELKTVTTSKPLCVLCANITSHLCKSSGAQVIKYSELIDVSSQEELKDNIFKNNLKHFSKGNINSVSKKNSKDIALSAYKCKKIAHIIFDNFKPNLTITANGKFIQTSYFMKKALEKKINILSYESFNSPFKLIVDRNKCSMDQMVSKKDLTSSLIPNFDDLKKYTARFKYNQRYGKITPFIYHNKKAFINKKQIFEKLGLSNKRKVLLIPNVSWDSTCLSMNGAFTDIEEWLNLTVEHLVNNNTDIIIRAHPAESKVPFHVKSRFSVIDLLSKNFSNKDNVKFIKSNDDIDTISLAKQCNKVIIFSSTIGLELPLYGIRPICPMKNYYSGFGFTFDTFTKEEYFNSLSNDFNIPKLTIKNLKNLYKLIFLLKEKGHFSLIEHDQKWPIKNYKDLEKISNNTVIKNLLDVSTGQISKFDIHS